MRIIESIICIRKINRKKAFFENNCKICAFYSRFIHFFGLSTL